MEETTRTRDALADGVIEEAGDELASLRMELARYRDLFDSARYIVGHEFAKPLTAASGYLDLLEELVGPGTTDKHRGYFAKIREAHLRLDELVESFVQLLRMEKSAEREPLERIELDALLARVLGRFGALAANVSIEIERGMPPFIARRRCIEVVLENLLSNAIKYGGNRGPVRVIATLARERRGDSREHLLVVTVEDHGEGIPREKLDEIFDPFVRLENGKESGGLGLGLALVKSAVSIMRGEIRVRSKPGEGTAITFQVPVSNANAVSTSDHVG